MPAREQDLTRFFTYLAGYYSKSTVSIAAAAVVALHRHNGYQHPFSDRVKQLLRGIDKTGLAGVRSQKFIIDQQFVVKMCQHFLSPQAVPPQQNQVWGENPPRNAYTDEKLGIHGYLRGRGGPQGLRLGVPMTCH